MHTSAWEAPHCTKLKKIFMSIIVLGILIFGNYILHAFEKTRKSATIETKYADRKHFLLGKFVVWSNDSLSNKSNISINNDRYKSKNTKGKHHDIVDGSTNSHWKYGNITDLQGYRNALEKNAENGIIILTFFEEGYADIAYNFYIVSIINIGIRNVLFISFSAEGCWEFLGENITCFHDTLTPPGVNDGKPSSYTDFMFFRKINQQQKFILQALKWNYTVFHVDVDVIFFKNPFPYMNSNCDIEGLWDCDANNINSGTIMVRPTDNTIAIYQTMVNLVMSSPVMMDQIHLNILISWTKRSDPQFKVKVLDSNKFFCGRSYFYDQKRYFVSLYKQYSECVLVHNNWIISKAAKVYRFKENGMWFYDKNNYYSNNKTKFIIYENPLKFENASISEEMEMDALRTALAIANTLHRKVVLPMFHCPAIRSLCGLNSYILIKDFDEQFENIYVEHEFPNHPLVPKWIFRRTSPTLLISNAQVAGVPLLLSDDVIQFRLRSMHTGILRWIKTFDHFPVLKFHSLYQISWNMTVIGENHGFTKKLALGFKTSEYGQTDCANHRTCVH